MKHSNISIFIPHLGCPFNCIFCDQYKITGSDSAVTPFDVYNILSQAAADTKMSKKDTQIAFFGGSFTAIDRALMISYLKTAHAFTGTDKFNSIRISTRPDCIDDATLDILKEFNVKTIELGIQSFDDDVLKASKRGYTAKTALTSCRLIQSRGFELGIQMMCGLPQDTQQKDIQTAHKIIELGCKQVRIYPVIVIEGTELCRQYRQGSYTPLTLDEAVDTCSKLYSMFYEKDITILKMGLHTASGGVAGPFHPAFGELVRSQVFYNEVINAIQNKNIDCAYTLMVAPSFVSTAVGNGKRNTMRFKSRGFNIKITADPSVTHGKWKLIKNKSL